LTAEETARATELLERAIHAHGGLDALRDVKTIVVRQTLESRAPDRTDSIETTSYIQYPDRFRTETLLGDGVSVNVQVFDGQKAWLKDRTGVRELPAAVARDARKTMRRDVTLMLAAAKAGQITVRPLADSRDATGSILNAIELQAPDLDPIVLYLDSVGRVVRESYVADAPGRPIVVESFGDYKPVNGLPMPFLVTRGYGEQSVARRVRTISINTPLDPSIFKRPGS
jgi:hypothetical protein